MVIVAYTRTGSLARLKPLTYRKVHLDSREVHVLAFSDYGIVFDSTGDFSVRFVAGQNCQDERSVRHENLLAGLDTGSDFIV